jgi:Flp pilus assembly CpaE family ATPase
MADDIILPVTPDIAALKTAVNTIRILKAVNINDTKMRVVLNEIIPKAGLTKQQVDTSLGKLSIMVPHAGSGFIDAANHGMPLVTLEDPPPAARALIEVARTVCEPEEVQAGAQKESKVGILNRLRRA